MGLKRIDVRKLRKVDAEGRIIEDRRHGKKVKTSRLVGRLGLLTGALVVTSACVPKEYSSKADSFRNEDSVRPNYEVTVDNKMYYDAIDTASSIIGDISHNQSLSSGESHTKYFYSDYDGYESKNTDNADRRLQEGEYVTVPVDISDDEYIEFITGAHLSYDTDYAYSKYYMIDDALSVANSYGYDPNNEVYTDLICDINEIPSSTMIYDAIYRNTNSYLASHGNYYKLDDKVLHEIANYLYEDIFTYYNKLNNQDKRRIYSAINDLVAVGINSDDYSINTLKMPYNARTTDDGIIMLDMDRISKLPDKISMQKTIQHEIYHIFQREAPDNIQYDATFIGGSSYYDELLREGKVNSLHWKFLYEGGAELQTMHQNNAVDPLVYNDMVGYVRSLDLITMIRPEYDSSAMEDTTLSLDSNKIYEVLGARTEEEKREIIKMLYSIDYIQSDRADFNNIYNANNPGRNAENDRKAIIREMKQGICITLTKYFYRNLAERVANTDVSLQDIYYLINVFEEDLSSHTDYDSSEKFAFNKEFMSYYIEVQDEFFNMIADDNMSFDDIVNGFKEYSMALSTNNGLVRNCELSWLNEKEKNFLNEDIMRRNMWAFTSNIRDLYSSLSSTYGK